MISFGHIHVVLCNVIEVTGTLYTWVQVGCTLILLHSKRELVKREQNLIFTLMWARGIQDQQEITKVEIYN